jgi:hypothetical protein
MEKKKEKYEKGSPRAKKNVRPDFQKNQPPNQKQKIREGKGGRVS